MQSPDQDFRCVAKERRGGLLTLYSFMGLNDLMNEIKQDPGCYTGDETSETKVLNQVLSLVEDKISEVKNQAVKWCVWAMYPCFAHQAAV